MKGQGNVKVLVIEDEKKIASFLRRGLEAQGFVVEHAANGDDGYALATTRPYDALVLDIMLPGRDGLSILRNLRERKISVPVILLTARSELNERLEGLNLGADDYLTKPVSKADLLGAIRARLRRAEQQGTREFKPDFTSPEPLCRLGLTPRVAEVLLWVAQGKTNADIATILGISESTVKKHLLEIFAVLGVETRSAATLRALEVLANVG